MKLIAIDFETANSSLCSACSLGLAIYDDGEIVDSYSFLIKTHPRYSYFTNTFIHHLTFNDVKDSPEFDYYYPQLKELLSNNCVAAHNAAFDVGVLNNICALYGLDPIPFTYIDTVTLARKIYPELYNHKLNTIASYMGIDLNHHEAASDAYACLLIVLAAMERYNVYDINDLAKLSRIRLSNNL